MAFNNEYPYVDPNRVNTDWMINEIKNVATQMIEINNNFDMLRNDFESFKIEMLSKFNEDLRSEVSNKIDEMLEDGVFNDLILRYSTLSTNLNFKRKWRHIHDVGEFSKNLTDDYPNVQGNCYFKIGLHEYVALIRKKSLTQSNNGLFCLYDYITGDLVMETEIEVGHGNSLTYFNNKLYLLYGSMIIDGTDQAINRVCEITIENNSITTNVFDINYVGELWGISSDGEELFFFDSNEHRIVKALSFENNIIEVVVVITLQDGGKLTAFQDFELNSRYYVVLSLLPSALFFFDKTGNLYKIINLNKYIGNMYVLGEAQGITLSDNGDLVMVSNGRIQHWSNLQNQICQCFHTNVFINSNNDYAFHDHAAQSSTLKCSNNSLSNNPDGSSTNPYKTIGEALLRIEAGKNFLQQYTIQLLTDFSNENINIYDKNITITAPSNRHNIGGCEVYNSQVTFNNIMFTQSLNNKPTACLIVNNQSVCILYMCKFNASEDVLRYETENGAILNASVGAIVTDISEELWAEAFENKHQYQINSSANFRHVVV